MKYVNLFFGTVWFCVAIVSGAIFAGALAAIVVGAFEFGYELLNW